jgi:hypothetical protein
MSTRWLTFFSVALLAVVFPLVAGAADILVNCDNPIHHNSINGALAVIRKEGPNTILVSGTCNEHVLIEDFDRLTLTGNPTATINAPTEGAPVVSILSSDHIELRRLTINGGINGAVCGNYSTCTLRHVTVQGATAFGVQIGPASSVLLRDNTVIQNNGADGVRLEDNSTVSARGSVTIQNNVEDGINADQGSSVRLAGTNISGNGNAGVVLRSSTLIVATATIAGNAVHGVAVLGLSRARFGGSNVITGNGQPDVNCLSANVLTSGTDNLGGGTTNCVDDQ